MKQVCSRRHRVLAWCVILMHSWGNQMVAQEVPIQNYSTTVDGRVQLEVNSSPDNYYILNVRVDPNGSFEYATSMTLGNANTTVISESLEGYPQAHYRVLEYSINNPGDWDSDGIDDITEFQNIPFQNPINAANEIPIEDGLVSINSYETFNDLSILQDYWQWTPYLNGKEYVKFIIDDFFSDNPKIYFINTTTYSLHVDFANDHGIEYLAPDVIKGQIAFHPTVISNNGTLGTYAFNFTNNESKPFDIVQRTHELLGANMFYLENNLSYYINDGNETEYDNEETLYLNSRIPVLFESDVYAGLDYWGLHQTEGFGLLRHMNLNEMPGPKDIVLYDGIPNSLPRVGGIITSVIQTPLSHVNLRAIQDNVPNAFIRDAILIDSIANLVDKYVYFKVDQSSYTLREATVDEVNNWYESLRPTEELVPSLNLDYSTIMPLDHITFDMYDGFGAKVTNVATMRRFGFADETIPDGFGVPFYFYRQFMQYNGFYEEVEQMIANPEFMADRDVRDSILEDFRERIEGGKMPFWMLNQLEDMQRSFPAETSIRCRSSTNNEDLPGFSGAGLYDSKTQHPNEGHIRKSIKQVYASLWNLRAFDEREFYRVNHFYTAMGVLCHPNYPNEKVNGVGVSADPIYQTEDTYYLNSQLGDELITNPEGNERPEELLLKRYPTANSSYSVIQYSSLVSGNSLLMTADQMAQLQAYLTVIHDQFAILYKAEDNPTFAMDIEYKINAQNQLIIKQARPWVSYERQEKEREYGYCDLVLFPNPAKDFVNVTCRTCALTSIRISESSGRVVLNKPILADGTNNSHIAVFDLPYGVYVVTGMIDDQPVVSKKLVIF